MNKIKLLFLTLVSFFWSIILVDANEIKNIDMEIYINSNGNASVVERWNVYLNEGTEGYRSFDLMGQSKISSFKVIDEDGREYENLSYWNVNGSFSSKAYKSGINKTSNGIELCWGISSYGNREYTLKYDISNFVTQYTDKQGIDFNLLDLGQVVKNANIRIYSDTLFSLDNSRIWAFGNDGNISFKDGAIVMTSDGKLKKNQYMTLLVRFEEDIFTLNNQSNKSFDEVYDEAIEGISFFDKVDDSREDNYDYNYDVVFIKNIILVIFFLIFLMVLAMNRKNKVLFSKHKQYDLYFGLDGKKLPKDSDIPYFRDIPCNKNLCYAYWVCYHYSLVPLDDLREGIIGAILLEWIKDGSITVVETKKKFLSFKDNNYAINFSEMKNVSNYVEYELYQMFKSASSDGNILCAYDFSKWCERNYEQVETWFYNIIGYTNIELERVGLITNRLEDSTTGYGINKKMLAKNVSISIKDEAIKLKGLKKYLLDFTLMKEKKYIEVHLWNEYLMFARLLGIADKVEEQFSKLYPQFEEVSALSNVFINSLVKDISHSGYDSFKRSRNRNSQPTYSGGSYSSSYRYSGTSRRSGGGGRSYRSGGRSSSRGSRGGGFR